MITFLVFAAIIDLNITVDVGFVTGVTPAITPIGSAINVYSVANIFFVILSS